jgi:hypothetical protein
MFKTLKSNVSVLELSGGVQLVFNQLPQTIQDAIVLTQELGEQYLWVDTLCVVQDDPVDMEVQLGQMDLIYRHATATIICLSGDDANAGIHGISRDFRADQHFVTTIDSWPLTAQLPDLLLALRDSKWNTRGWTYQELMLSKRAIFLGEYQVYFQCRSGLRMEDRLHEIQNVNELEPFLASLMNPIVSQLDMTDGKRANLLGELVFEYSKRELRYPQEAVAAFRGILSTIQQFFGWHFVSALPEERLDTALLWMGSNFARLPSTNAPGSTSHYFSTKDSNDFPTWC